MTQLERLALIRTEERAEPEETDPDLENLFGRLETLINAYPIAHGLNYSSKVYQNGEVGPKISNTVSSPAIRLRGRNPGSFVSGIGSGKRLEFDFQKVEDITDGEAGQPTNPRHLRLWIYGWYGYIGGELAIWEVRPDGLKVDNKPATANHLRLLAEITELAEKAYESLGPEPSPRVIELTL